MMLMHILYYKCHSQSEIFEILPNRTSLLLVLTNSFSDRVIYMHTCTSLKFSLSSLYAGSHVVPRM